LGANAGDLGLIVATSLATNTGGTVTTPAGWAAVTSNMGAFGLAVVLYKILAAADLAGAGVSVTVTPSFAGKSWQFDVVSIKGVIVGNTAGAGGSGQAFNSGTGGTSYSTTTLTMTGTVAASAVAVGVAAAPAANGALSIDGLPMYSAPAGGPNNVAVGVKLVGQGQSPTFAVVWPSASAQNCAELLAVPQ
jgi:hypothetical protein